MPDAQPSTTSAFVALVLIGVVLLPWVTLAISEVLLAFYRHAVVAAMRGQLVPQPSAREARPADRSGRHSIELDVEQTGVEQAGVDQASGDAERVPRPGDQLYRGFQLATRRSAIVYTAAGLAYAAFLATAMTVRASLPLPWAWLLLTFAFAWPVVFTAILILSPTRRWQTALVAAYWTLFLSSTSYPFPEDTLLAIFMANIGGTIVAVTVRTRRIRAVAPLVGAALTLLGVAGVFAIQLAAEWGRRPDGTNGVDNPFLFLFVFALVLAAGPVCAWLALRALGAMYARKQTSDQTIGMAAVWLIFAGVQSSTFASDDARWMAAGIGGFAVFLAVSALGFRIARRRAVRAHAPRLLVLRVFALGRRSRRLFDRLALRWRHIGSVQLIAGPDLATSTVEPHEFMDFVRRRLGSRFLDTPASIESAMGDLDTAPDHDGRFRITDFFCRDSAWRTVFGRLAAGSDVVLMDLRGFSTGNSGCTYELGELLNVVPLERIAIVVDQFTDESFLTQTLDDACARLGPGSPNRDAAPARLRVFRETGWRGLDPDRLLRLLCDAAARPRRAPLAHVS